MNPGEWFLVAVITVLSVFLLVTASPEPIAAAQAAIEATRLAGAGQAVAPVTPAAPETLVAKATRGPLPTFTAQAPARTPTSAPTATPAPTLTPTPFPFDTHPELDRYIYVDQKVQRMYLFSYGELFRVIPVSTGRPTNTTYTEAWEGTVGQYWGTFQSFGSYADRAWYLYYSLGSILVHSLPYNYENGEKVYEDREMLGVQPSSHGCIRISPEDAEWFTEWNPEGVLITVSDPYLEYWQGLN